ncbi:MAG: substrate-binding domain-containing protein [Bacillota bacterium]
MQKVTIYDVAREANTSICTVNKALTGKPKVSEKKRREIVEVASRLGYQANRVAQSLARPSIKIGIIMPAQWPQFHEPLAKGLARGFELLRDNNVSGVYGSFPNLDVSPAEMLSIAEGMIAQEAAAMIVSPSLYHDITPLMRRLDALQIPLLLLGNNVDTGHCLTYVGIDSRLSGRMAAELASLLMPAPPASAAVVIGSAEIANHAEKAEAFMEECAKRRVITAGVFESKDDPAVCEKVMEALFARHPDTRVIYAATGTSVPVCRFLQDRGLRARVIATDVFPELIPYMRSGLVPAALYQDALAQGKAAVDTLYAYLTEHTQPPVRILIPPQLVLAGNAHLFL